MGLVLAVLGEGRVVLVWVLVLLGLETAVV